MLSSAVGSRTDETETWRTSSQNSELLLENLFLHFALKHHAIKGHRCSYFEVVSLHMLLPIARDSVNDYKVVGYSAAY